MQEMGQLNFLDLNQSSIFPGFDFITVDGHTDKQMLPKIQYKGHTIVFVADLLPSVGHIPIPYVMGYDTRPLLTMDEKTRFLDTAAKENWILFFEHDPVNECCTVKLTEKGVRVDHTFKLNEI
jgi:glyoxylase-like metal-dependent hydrolase (beta-lactamase superfamily II)